MALLGSNSNRANGLFAQGYTIYAIFLAIATFGVPAAISKLVAEFNARHDVYQSRQLMASVYDIRCHTRNCIWVCNLSFNTILSMGTRPMFIPGISRKVVEQIARVIYMLVTAVIILRVNPGNWSGVVVQSTFAAFIGAIFSMLVLIWGWFKYRYMLIKPLYPNAQHV
jgi:O-antigen/teichoic acid export membrane protein